MLFSQNKMLNLHRQLVCFLFKAVLRIGGNAMKQECDHLMTKPLDMSSQEILRDLNQANVDIELIKQTLDTEVKQDIKNLKRSHNLLQHKQNVSNQQAKRFKKDVNRLELDQINVNVDVKKLKSTCEDPVPWNRRGTKYVFNLVLN